jgi:hypothetical protein
MNIAEVQEPDIVLRSTLPADSDYELVPPPADDATEEPALFVDIDPATIEERIAGGGSQTLRLLVQCPVVPGTYQFTLTVKWGASTTDLPIEAECKDAPIPTVVAANTKVTDPASRLSLDAFDPDSGTMEFTASNAFLAALEVGDVLVSEPTAVAPEGFLRRITAIKNEAGRVILETVQAGLDEAFIQMSINEDYTPDTIDLQNLVLFHDGIEAAVEYIDNQAALSFSFNEVVFDQDGDSNTTEDQFRINGSISVQPSFPFKASLTIHYEYKCIGPKWRGKCRGVVTKVPTRLSTYFYAGANINQQTNLKAVGSVAFSRTRQIPIAEHNFSPLTVLVGVVPVVITHRLTFFIDTDLNITARLDYEFQQVANITAGIEYNGGLRPVSSRTRSSTEKFDFSGELAASGMFGSRWESKLYGVVGPFVQFRAGLQLTAAVSSGPNSFNWRLNGCTDGKAGLTDSFKIFSNKLDPVSYNLFAGCSLIREGQSGGATPPSITSFTAEPSTITAGQSTTLSWSVAGTAPITLSINQGVGDVSGRTSVTASPTTTTTYTLTATNSAGSDSRQATVTVTPPPLGNVAGQVIDRERGEEGEVFPIQGATVSFWEEGSEEDLGTSTMTAADGSFSRSLPEGTYNFKASHRQYHDFYGDGVVIVSGGTTTVEIQMFSIVEASSKTMIY